MRAASAPGAWFAPEHPACGYGAPHSRRVTAPAGIRRHPKEDLVSMAFDPNDNPCVICGPDNPIGLHIQWDARNGESVANVAIPEDFQGWRGVVHGGLVAALLDEAMWYATYSVTGTSVLTVALETRYHHPTPVGHLLHVTGHALSTRHHLTDCTAEVRDAESGAVLASARGRFMPDRSR